MSQASVTVTTPLAANAIFTTGIRHLDPDYPYLSVSVQSAQGGTLAIYERGDDQALEVQTAVIPITGGAAATFVNVHIRLQHWRIQYTNGTTLQTTFTLTYSTNPLAAQYASQAQLMWAVLKELRAIALLIAALREPVASQVNVPYGTDFQLPQ